MLTQRMRQCRQAIIAYQAAHNGVSPSRRELADAIGTSAGHVNHLLDAMEERGSVRRCRHRVRAIEVLPETVPVVAYPGAAYYVVERVDGEAKLLPLSQSNRVA